MHLPTLTFDFRIWLHACKHLLYGDNISCRFWKTAGFVPKYMSHCDRYQPVILLFCFRRVDATVRTKWYLATYWRTDVERLGSTYIVIHESRPSNCNH